MSEPKSENHLPADSASAGDAVSKVPAPSAGAPAPLTKEEQWALFEKELKESDWGHQPC